jgi:hypothetical protein
LSAAFMPLAKLLAKMPRAEDLLGATSLSSAEISPARPSFPALESTLPARSKYA